MKAQLSGDAALIAHLRLEIAKLTRTLYGQRSERTQRLIDQYELQLEELEASAAADALAAEKAAAKAAVPAPMGTAEALAPALPGPPAARSRRGAGPDRLPVLRRGAPVEGGRRRHRNAGGGATPVDGDPDRARALLLPGLREHHPGARALPRRAARLGRPEPARHGAVREIWAARPAEPAGRALRPRGRAAQPVDAGRSGGHLRGRAGAAVPAHRKARHGGGTVAWR